MYVINKYSNKTERLVKEYILSEISESQISEILRLPEEDIPGGEIYLSRKQVEKFLRIKLTKLEMEMFSWGFNSYAD